MNLFSKKSGYIFTVCIKIPIYVPWTGGVGRVEVTFTCCATRWYTVCCSRLHFLLLEISPAHASIYTNTRAALAMNAVLKRFPCRRMYERSPTARAATLSSILHFLDTHSLRSSLRGIYEFLLYHLLNLKLMSKRLLQLFVSIWTWNKETCSVKLLK